jgi:hypothetical protein
MSIRKSNRSNVTNSSNITNIGYPEWLELTALQIMDDFTGSLDMNSSLGKLLDVFNKTKLAFVPITANKSSDKIGSTRDSTS